jgi:prohibitin 1
MNKLFNLFIAIVISVSVISVVFCSVGLVVISSKEVGVKSVWGKIQDEPMTEGIHIRNIISTRVAKIDMRERTKSITTQTVSKEGLQFDIKITVRYRVKNAVYLVKNLQTDLSDLMASYANATIDDVASGKDKNELYSDVGRIAITQSVADRLSKELSGYAIIGQVIFENIVLPVTITEAIQAQQASLEKIKEKENMKEVAKKEADIRRIEAQGIADANQIIQLSLTDRYLQYEAIQKLNPTAEKVFIPTQGVLPMIDLGR